MIRDNREADDIIKRLDDLGVVGVTPQNVSAWKKYGYQKWLRRQERIEGMRARMEFARKLAGESGGENGGMALQSDAASRIAVDGIMAVLEEFDPALLSALLREKPEKFMDLLHSLSDIRKRDQDAVILRQKVAEYQRRVRQLTDVASENGVATQADISKIFAEGYGT